MPKGSLNICLFLGLGACSPTSQAEQPCDGEGFAGISEAAGFGRERGSFPGLRFSVSSSLLHCGWLFSFQKDRANPGRNLVK